MDIKKEGFIPPC